MSILSCPVVNVKSSKTIQEIFLDYIVLYFPTRIEAYNEFYKIDTI